MIFIIVPCYNESKRFSTSSYLDIFKSHKNIKIAFANDGSSDDTKDIIEDLASKAPQQFLVFNHPKNIGKGPIIRKTFFKFINEVSEAEWVGYWDADLSTPLEEIFAMIKYSELYPHKVDAIWASRIVRLGANIDRPIFRQFLSYNFSSLIHLLFKFRPNDPQSGAKIFRTKLAKVIFQDEFISKWLFDLELILRSKNAYIIEYPIINSTHKAGSNFKLYKESIRVFYDLIKMKIKYGKRSIPE